MATKETAVKTAIKKDVDLKGVRIAYMDSLESLQRVYKERKAEGSIEDKGDLFVHILVEKDGIVYGNEDGRLSQTLRVLGKSDYDFLWEAYESGTPVDLRIRVDEYSKKTKNYFFYVSHGKVSSDEFFEEDFGTSAKRASSARKSAVDLLG